MSPDGTAQTYLLVDGENIDATLGQSILGRRPRPDERPRWDRLLRFAEDHWDQPVRGLFFLAVTGGELPGSFVQALVAIGFRPIPLAGSPDEKVVDQAIQRTLEAIADRTDDVMLVSNDGDFVPQITPLVTGRRRVGVLGFDEFRNGQFSALESRGLELLDLEHDAEVFNVTLPRLRIIPIDEFDPLDFL